MSNSSVIVPERYHYTECTTTLSLLQDPEVIPRQKCRMNTCPVLSCCGVMSRNWRWYDRRNTTTDAGLVPALRVTTGFLRRWYSFRQSRNSQALEPKVPYCVYKNVPMVPLLSQISPVNTLTFGSFEILSSPFVRSYLRPDLQKVSFIYVFRPIFLWISHLSCTCYNTCPS